MEEKPRIDNDNLELINEKKDSFRKPSLWQVGALFSFVVIIFLYLGARLQRWNVNYGLFLSEVGLIFLPPVLFLIIFKFDVKKVLRINKPGFLNLILIFGIMIFSLPVIGVLNLLNYWIIKQIFGRYEIFQAPISTESWGLLVGILIIGVLAGICEETLFRGFIQRGLERFGAVKSILITAVLFGLMHMDFQRFLGTFLLGALFGYLTYKSNSIFSSMFAHFANNSIAVCLTYVSLKANELLKQSGVNGIDNIEKISNGDVFESLASMGQIEIIAFTIVYAIIFSFSVAWLIILLRFFTKHNSKRETEVPIDEWPIPVGQLVSFIPGIAFILFIYILDILRMGNIIDQPTAEQILRSIGM